MERVRADDITFLDATGPGQEPEADTSDVLVSNGSPWRFVLIACLAVGAAWFVVSGAEPGEEPPVAFDDSPSPTVAPISPMVRGGGEFALADVAPEPPDDTWPNPPIARDPYVVRVPGPDVLPGDVAELRLGSTTVVYVNTNGDPTVVAFDTADVFEVNVAATRVHETFAVERGAVVSLEGANPGLDDATDDAVIFHTYRDVDTPGIGVMGDQQGIGSGPELCLSDSSCARPGLGLERVVVGDLVVERFDPEQHPEVAAVFTSWEPVDRWLIASDGYRIPAPVGTIWVIAPLG